MPIFNKRKPSEDEIRDIENIAKVLAQIYSNKSSDEFKCKGDIRKVSSYKQIEMRVTDLTRLKRFSANDAKDIKDMFLTLHRPVFNDMVVEYLAKPNERNTLFTALFTVAYRVLVGELARIYASTEATDKGIVYKPDKISRRNDMSWFIKHFNRDLDAKIDMYVRQTFNEYAVFHEGAVRDVIDAGVDYTVKALLIIPRIFSSAKEINPISFINAILMRSYSKKVDKFTEVTAMYEATKQAYEDYLKIPEADRKRKIEAKYRKNIEKYNIQMNNLKAKIEHYDSRAIEEAKDSRNKSSAPKTSTTPTTTTTPDDKPADDTPTDQGTDDFDF